jgi:hypothetical protein
MTKDSKPDMVLDDIGPIEHMEFSLPDGGGIVVFRGRNGVGKTHALDAIDKMTTGRGGASVRDHQKRGVVSGLGMKLFVGGNTRRKGELSVEVLDSALSLADLVDPHLKSVAAADAKRIKTLVALSGAKPDIELFRTLVDDDTFENHVAPAATKADDLISQAASVKRSIESATRVVEKLRDKAKADAEAHNMAVGDVDLSDVPDETGLRTALQDAMMTRSRLIAERDAADAVSDAIHKARTELAESKGSYAGPTVEAAELAFTRADTAEADAETQYGIAKKAERVAIDVANKAAEVLKLRKQELHAANAAVGSAVSHQADIDGWQTTIDDSEALPSPTAAAISEASDTLTEAQDEYDRIAEYNILKASQDRAAEATAEYEARKAEAEQLREAARGTDDVLSDVVAGLGIGIELKVEADRLYVDTTRGQTPFCELSMGERWRLAIDVAVAVAPSQALFPVPQEGWEGLDPINRQEVLTALKEHGVWILTAEASGDDGIVAAEYTIPKTESE